MGKLSVVIAALNEEENIRDCLESIKWADEIIIVDMFSTDKTLDICREYTNLIFQNNEGSVIYKNKNLGISKATGDWILILDADERVSHELKEELIKIINSAASFDGYFLLFKHYQFGRWLKHGGWYPSYIKRFFRGGKAEFPEKSLVHEVLEISGPVGYIKQPVIHYNHKNINEFLEKINFYSSQDAEGRYNEGQKAGSLETLIIPLLIFIKRYFLLLGFLDGREGLITNFLYAFYSFLWRAKLMELHFKNSGKPAGDSK